MSKLLDKIFKRKEFLEEKKRLYNEYDRNILGKHIGDLGVLEITIFEKFQNEYLTNNDDILNICYEMTTDTLPGGTKVIIFYNNHGYRMISSEKFIINRDIAIDTEIKKIFPGIKASFSSKQVISSVLNDKNPIIEFNISREDFKKVLDKVKVVKEERHENYRYHIKCNYYF